MEVQQILHTRYYFLTTFTGTRVYGEYIIGIPVPLPLPSAPSSCSQYKSAVPSLVGVSHSDSDRRQRQLQGQPLSLSSEQENMKTRKHENMKK
jgi:hypothetical protein